METAVRISNTMLWEAVCKSADTGCLAIVKADQPGLSPVEFAGDVLGVELWAKQRELLSALPAHHRVAVKSGNGLGKGFSAAVAVLWFLYTHDQAIVLSTAPTFRQVRYILWRQIHSLYRRAPETLGGRLLDTRWELDDDRYALGLSADGPDQFQGFHSPNMLIVVDEAEGVSDNIYEAIEAVMTSRRPPPAAHRQPHHHVGYVPPRLPRGAANLPLHNHFRAGKSKP